MRAGACDTLTLRPTQQLRAQPGCYVSVALQEGQRRKRQDWAPNLAPPKQPAASKQQQQPAAGSSNSRGFQANGGGRPHSSTPAPPDALQQQQQQEQEHRQPSGSCAGQPSVWLGGPAGQVQRAQLAQQAAADPFALLAELQGTLEGYQLDPAELMQFDLAWLGMSPAQQTRAHSAITSAATVPGPGGRDAVRRAVAAAVAGSSAGAGGADADPHAMLCELQEALAGARLPNPQVTEFELAWLTMTPQQQQCLHRAITRAAAAAARPGPGSTAAAAAVRELAARGMASLQHAAAAPCDPHAQLCRAQELLADAELPPGQLTQFEMAWLGQRSGAWWESIDRMVGRAHSQGPEALKAVVATVVRTSGG
jgi:hypothetical protein